MKKIKFPSREDIEDFEKIVEENEKKGQIRTLLPSNASELDLLKEALCEEVIKFKIIHSFSNLQLADVMEIDPARVSELLYCKVHLFSVDRLISYLYKLSDHDLELKSKLKSVRGIFKVSQR